MWEMKERNEWRRQPSDAEEPRSEGADAAEWVRTRLELPVDALQARVLRTTNKRGILNCSRQWGKSTITAAKAVHQAYHTAESLTVVVSPSGRQSGEFLRKATGFARKLGIRPKGDGDNEISLELPNGSRIVGLPGTEATVRGFSAVSLLLVDEAARVQRRPVPGDPADAGGERRDVVADEHAVRQAGVLLRDLGERRTGMGAIPGAGHGMRADPEGISGRGARHDGGALVPAGVPVRVRGHVERGVRAGAGGGRDHG